MPTLTLKNVPAAIHRGLKVRARQNRRSLNREAIACLASAIELRPVDPETLLAQARALRERVRGRLTDEALSQMKSMGRP